MPLGRYLVIDSNGVGHLPVRDTENGPLNHHLMGAAWAALHGGFRGQKYEGPDRQKAIEKLKALYQSEGIEMPAERNSEANPLTPALSPKGAKEQVLDFRGAKEQAFDARKAREQLRDVPEVREKKLSSYPRPLGGIRARIRT